MSQSRRGWLTLGVMCLIGLTVRADWTRLLEADWLEQAVMQPASKEVSAAADAAGAVDGVKNGKWGFHTGLANDPWWQVDLGEVREIGRVVIWNRCDTPKLMKDVELKLSVDGKTWTTAYKHDGTLYYGFTDKKPLNVKVEGAKARFVRVQLSGEKYLYLDELEVFGAGDEKTNLALNKPANQVSVSQWSVNHARQAEPDLAAKARDVLAFCETRCQELKSAGVDVSVQAAKLNALKGRVESGADRKTYLEIMAVRRALMLANPLLDFDSVLFTKRVPGTFNHMSDQYYGWWSRPGGGIYILSGIKSGEPKVVCLTDSFKEPGSFLRPMLSFDGKKVLFAWCKYYPELAKQRDKLNKGNVPEDAFYHVFEMNIDGSNVRKLTGGKYDDFDARYLPDGRIVFCSTRRGQSLQAGKMTAEETLKCIDGPDIYVRCGGDAQRPVAVYTLHTMDGDGKNVIAISPFEMFEWEPSVAADGSILYSRWDYIDRDNMPYMKLWAINPDGTNARLIYGNYTKAPHCTFEPRSIPGSNKIMVVASGHHSQTMGSLVLLDPSAGMEGKDPLTRLTPEICFPEIEGWPTNFYANPWPLSERHHLVSWGIEPTPSQGKVRLPNAMGLYLFDAQGGREMIYRDPDISSMYPIPLRSQPTPPVIASGVNWDGPQEGRFMVADVTQGLKTVKQGDIKALRIVGVPGKTQPWMNQPSIGVTRDDPGKVVLGTVPVEKDGSAYFKVPSGVIVFFQALDARGVAVQSMKSVTYVQPGQTVSCIGCHEDRNSSAAATSSKPLASLREPSKLIPGPEGSWPLRFDKLVQPVLEARCVSCHDAKVPMKGHEKGAKTVLTADKAYDTLVKFGKPSLHEQVWAGYRLGYSIEGEGLAAKSALLALLTDAKGHYGVKVEGAELERFVVWMDCYAQRQGSFGAEQEKQLEEFRQRVISSLTGERPERASAQSLDR